VLSSCPIPQVEPIVGVHQRGGEPGAAQRSQIRADASRRLGSAASRFVERTSLVPGIWPAAHPVPGWEVLVRLKLLRNSAWDRV